MGGWIKLHRTINKWGWKKSPNHVAVFIDLLLMANHEESEFMGTKIPRGSLTTSSQAISDRTGVGRQSVRTILNHLKSTKELTITTTTKFTMISINNWDEYQLANQDPNQRLTNDQPTTNQQLTTSKNLNKSKKERSINIMEKSPLAFLFMPTDPIQEWLVSPGSSESVQQELLDTVSHHVLAEEIKTAYQWQLEKDPRNAGLYLKNWIKNKKTYGLGLKKAQKSFSRKGHGVMPSDQNPTGNPYIQEALDKGMVG